jgi:hypothetical protein
MNPTTPTPTTPTPPARTDRLAATLAASLTVALFTVAAWLRGPQPADDRGSDTSEKAFMVILAITLGTAVSGAAVAFIATKTALFR